MIGLDITSTGDFTAVARQIGLPPALQRKLVARIGRMVIAQAKKNVKTQTDVAGHKFEPRKRLPQKQRIVYHFKKRKLVGKSFKKTHQEMFFDMVKGDWLRFDQSSESRAEVNFARGVGFVAYKHQHGGKKSGVSRERLSFPYPLEPEQIHHYSPRRVRGQKGCTWSQAALLVQMGYYSRTLFGPGVRPDQLMIMENMTKRFAIMEIAKLMKHMSYQRIADKTPSRPFLGASAEQIRLWRRELLQDIGGSFRAKNYQHLLS